MQGDRYGYELTTPSPAAPAAWREGADRFLAADGGALEAFERAIVEDDAFALAHAGRARVLYLRGRNGEARVEAERARALVANGSERERSHAVATLRDLQDDANEVC